MHRNGMEVEKGWMDGDSRAAEGNEGSCELE